MLVSCKKCSVRVHASEYLSPFSSPVPAAWACLLEVVVTYWPSQLRILGKSVAGG